MSIKPQFETYRYTGEICVLQSQSIVECRLPGSEIGSILAVQATASPVDCACADGEARYNGKLFLCVVYEDADGKICRAERGAEFFHKAEGGAVTPACFAKAALVVENVSYRREGSGVYLSAIVGAKIGVYGSKQLEYFCGGEELLTKKGKIELAKTLCVSGETEAEDEFETDYVGDILLHAESAIAHRVEVGAGQIDLEGELLLSVCALGKENDVCSYERLLPFRLQIPCEDAFGSVAASARVRVLDARLTAGVDEEKGRSKVLFSYRLAADCFLHEKQEIEVVEDAFSCASEIFMKKQNDGGRYLTNTVKCVERIDGGAVLSGAVETDYALEAALMPRGEIVCKQSERGVEAEGIVTAELLLKAADGGRKTRTLSLPFAFPVPVSGEQFEAECIVCGLNVRRRKDGETEAEATVKAVVRAYAEKEWQYVAEVKTGEAYKENDAAFSVYVPAEGEDLWQVAKRLRRDPEELAKSNPELKFPAPADERIFVYRQIK